MGAAHLDRIDFGSDDINHDSSYSVYTRGSPRVKTSTAKCHVKTIINAALSAVT